MFILAHSLGVQSIMAEKARLQEREAAAHTAQAVRKQREMNAGAQLAFSFFLDLRPMEQCCNLQGKSPLLR